jgi:hypothetical protein
MEEVNLVNVESSKIFPTWRNQRTEKERVAKRLDRFWNYHSLISNQVKIRTWMEIGVESDHHPILFQIEKEMSKPSIPLKSIYN